MWSWDCCRGGSWETLRRPALQLTSSTSLPVLVHQSASWFEISFYCYVIAIFFLEHFPSKSIRLTEDTKAVMNLKASPSFLAHGIMTLTSLSKLFHSFQAIVALCVLLIKIECPLKAIPASCDAVIKIISASNTSFPSCQL